MIFAVCFTNFGPYHLARLRALADPAARARRPADRLRGRRQRADVSVAASGTVATSRSSGSRCSPTASSRRSTPTDCRQAMCRALDRDRPDALGIVGYARPESMAAARWARPQRPAGDPDVREPGDRPAAALVEGADQDGGGCACSTRRWSAGRRAPRLPGRARDACRPDRPGLQRRRQRLLRDAAPTARARHPDGTARLARRPLFPDGLPVRAREEPGPADRGIRPISRAGDSPRLPGTWCSAATVPAGERGRAPRSTQSGSCSGHSPAGLSPGRCACLAGMLMPRRSCCRACRSPGAWSSTRPPPAACPCWSPTAPAASETLVPDPQGRPACDSTRSTSKK